MMTSTWTHLSKENDRIWKVRPPMAFSWLQTCAHARAEGWKHAALSMTRTAGTISCRYTRTSSRNEHYFTRVLGQVEIFWRVKQYERLFPELMDIAHIPTRQSGFLSGTYLREKLTDVLVVTYCVPEVNMCQS